MFRLDCSRDLRDRSQDSQISGAALYTTTSVQTGAADSTAQEAEKLYIACSSWIFVSSLLSYHCPFPSLNVFSAVFLPFKHIIIRSIFYICDNIAFLRFSHSGKVYG